MYVVRFDAATGRHTLKFRQELFSLRLRDFLVRKNVRWNRPEADVLNTPTNSGLVESGEVRKYRGAQGLQASEDLNWHCLPQVVGKLSSLECSSCSKATRTRRKATSRLWCIGSRLLGANASRYAFDGSIEVLVLWDEGSLMEAQWIPQSRLRNHGEKELRDYFNAQLLFSSLWKHVLNIAEVGIDRGN